MTRTFLRPTISALAALAFTSAFSSNPVSAQTHEVGHWLGFFSLAQGQSLSFCFGYSSPASDSAIETEIVSLSLRSIEPLEVPVEHELRITAGEFRCLDFSYQDLVDAGFPTDPDTRVVVPGTYDVIYEPLLSTGTIPYGAFMLLDDLTGRTQLYEPIGDNGGLVKQKSER